MSHKSAYSKFNIEKNHDIICFLFVIILYLIYGITDNNILLIILFIYLAIKILFQDSEKNLYMIFCLIPNIRMFDGIGVTYLVNILLSLIVFSYVIKNKISIISLCSCLVIIIMEAFHFTMFDDIRNIFEYIPIVLSFLWSINILVSKIDFDKDKLIRSLSIGLLYSFCISIVIDYSGFIRRIGYLSHGNLQRFTATAGEANYLSLYCLVALFSLPLIKNRNGKDWLLIIIDLLVGFMTFSKMFILVLFVGIFIYSINFKIHIYKKYIYIGALFILLLIIFNEEIIKYSHIMLSRFSNVFSGSKRINFDLLTTSRSTIWIEYIKLIFSDALLFAFGGGMFYDVPLIEHVPHNTYIDLLISYGVVGTCIFILIIYITFKKFKLVYNIKIKLKNGMSLIMLLICMFGLSCLSANMFPFILTYTILLFIDNTNVNTVIQ